MLKKRDKLGGAWEMFAESGSVGAYLLYCAMKRAKHEQERGERE